jgi:hypothetical protein
VLAALIGFGAASSNVTAFMFAVMVAARVVALPELREHAVSLGWAAGCLVQVPNLIQAGSSRLGGRLASPRQSIAFYGHDVVLPALGWHLSWLLRDWLDRDYALILVGGVLAVTVGLILALGTWRVRMFAITALGLGFLFAVVSSAITSWVPILPVSAHGEPGARYTCLPIFLITAVLIVAADAALAGRARPAATAGTLALILVLCIGWIPDFRYTNGRDARWAPIASSWLEICHKHPSLLYKDAYDNNTVLVIPCSRIRGSLASAVAGIVVDGPSCSLFCTRRAIEHNRVRPGAGQARPTGQSRLERRLR